MKVWIFQTPWDYSGGAEVTKVFDSKEKAENWQKRMEELDERHKKIYERINEPDFNVDTAHGKVLLLEKEAGSDYPFHGGFFEMEVK